MKKNIFFLLILVATNIFGAADNNIEDKLICEISEQFAALLNPQDFDAIESLIIHNIDLINKSCKHGNTLLMVLCVKVRKNKEFSDEFVYNVTKLLIQLGADVLIKNYRGETALFLIPHFVLRAVQEIEKEKEELNKSLLDVTELPSEIIEIINNFHSAKQPKLKGHPILNAPDFHYLNSPLHSVSSQSLEATKALIEHKADLEMRNATFETPIFSAIRNTEILKLLIEARANINHQAQYNETPLEQAKKLGAHESVRILSEAIKEQKKNNQCCVIQ